MGLEKYDTSQFIQDLKELGVSLTDKQIEQFSDLLRIADGVEFFYEFDSNYGV